LKAGFTEGWVGHVNENVVYVLCALHTHTHTHIHRTKGVRPLTEQTHKMCKEKIKRHYIKTLQSTTC